MAYVKDICQAFYVGCFTDREYGVYKAGTGTGISLLDQIKGIIQVFDEKKTSRIIMGPDRPNAPQYIMDIKKPWRNWGIWAGMLIY